MTNVVTGRSTGIRRGLLIAAAGTLIMGVGMTVVRDAAWILGAGVAVLVVGCVQAAMAARGRAGTRQRTSPAWIGGVAVAFAAVMIAAVRIAGAGHWWVWTVVGALAAVVLVAVALRQGRA
ncbi:hypothetical protein GCM10018953_00200 [Streptosporangium nondiastaticum]|uniref:hypothetical protein n=1 Tax=Streptosporangium nondiastaticum TaxID=35764 RepID=UPI0031F93853